MRPNPSDQALLDLLRQGAGVREIAVALGIPEKEVRPVVAALLKKLKGWRDG